MREPDDYGFDEEALLLRDQARRFFAERLPVDALHRLVAADPQPERGPALTWKPELWQEMVELGWTALAAPESAGGVGMPWVAVAALVEEAGRAALPAPLLVTQCSCAVLRACGEEASTALEDIVAGAGATIAMLGSSGEADSCAVEWRDGALHGEAFFVQDPGKCSRLLVRAKYGQGAGWFWVACDAPGVELLPDAIVDLTRDQARVRFDAAEALRLSPDADAVWQAAAPAVWTLCAADMVGAAEWQLQTTVDYAQQRQQFDRPLGFFQAIKHDLVDVMSSIDGSRSLVYGAACALDHDAERACNLAHMAKASASDTAAQASGRSIQCHGGIGFTWEAHPHLYFKRQKHSQLLWGDARWHRQALARRLIDGDPGV